MAKKFPTDLTAAAVSAADYLIFSDASDSNAAKKISIDDFFKTPPDNTLQAGDATHGYKGLYLSNGTTTASIIPGGSVGNEAIIFKTAGTPRAYFDVNGLLPGADAAYRIGGSTLGYTSAYFSNGTGRGRIFFDGNNLNIGTTTADNFYFSVNSVNIALFNTAGFLPNANTFTLGADSLTNAWRGAYLTDGTAKASMRLVSNILYVGTTTNHNVYFRHNDATVLVLEATSLSPGGTMSIGKSTAKFTVGYINEVAQTRETIVAAGSTQADATAVGATYSAVESADGTKGVKLRIVADGVTVKVYNKSGTGNLKVYPPVGESIYNEAANAAKILAPAEEGSFTYFASINRWYGAVAVTF